MRVPTRKLSSRALLAAACVAGLVHAAFSLYWALGGSWLIETVGQWAVDWSREAPTTAALVLAAIAAVKAAGAVVPLLVESGRLPGRNAWRTLSWAGAIVLLAYGAANTVGAWLVLAGVVGDASTDPPALLGHALLWDPLFALWGGFLALGLRRSSQRRPAIASGLG